MSFVHVDVHGNTAHLACCRTMCENFINSGVRSPLPSPPRLNYFMSKYTRP